MSIAKGTPHQVERLSQVRLSLLPLAARAMKQHEAVQRLGDHRVPITQNTTHSFQRFEEQ